MHFNRVGIVERICVLYGTCVFAAWIKFGGCVSIWGALHQAVGRHPGCMLCGSDVTPEVDGYQRHVLLECPDGDNVRDLYDRHIAELLA